MTVRYSILPTFIVLGIHLQMTTLFTRNDIFVQLASVMDGYYSQNVLLICDYMICVLYTACSNGYYGKNCVSVCSPNCRTCKHTDGTCSCYAGWREPNCTNGICLK